MSPPADQQFPLALHRKALVVEGALQHVSDVPEGKFQLPKKENLLQIENLMIDLNSHEVFLDGESLVLPNKEFELLVFLAKNPNIVFSKDQLFEKIWGLDAIGEISTVTVHINRIREKIEKDSANPKFIETVWGSGYRFRKY